MSEQEAELEQLVERATQEAQTFTERALKGIEGLALLEQSVVDAEKRLEHAIATSREVLTKTVKAADEAQAFVHARDEALQQQIKHLLEQAGKLDAEMETTTAAVVRSSVSVATASADVVKSLKTQLTQTVQAADQLQRLARAEVAALTGEVHQLTARLVHFRTTSEEVDGKLATGLSSLLEQHDRLDAVLQARIDQLTHAYDATMRQADARVGELEKQLEGLVKGLDGHLDQRLVRDFGANLRKAADQFSGQLSTLEKELDGIHSSIADAHTHFHDNHARAIQPGIKQIGDSLYQAGQTIGMF